MWDAVNWRAIPQDAGHVALYDDGALYTSPPDAFAQFETNGATIEHITVTGQTLSSKWGDVEWGDMNEQQAAGWLQRKAGAGLGQGGVYASVSRLPAVVAACGQVPLWSAHYGIGPHVCGVGCGLPADVAALVVGTQYADHGPNGEDYDLSLLSERWPA